MVAIRWPVGFEWGCRGPVGQGHCNFQPRRRQGVGV